jgi:hypothetical protein
VHGLCTLRRWTASAKKIAAAGETICLVCPDRAVSPAVNETYGQPEISGENFRDSRAPGE